MATGIPITMAAVLFVFPIVFLVLLWNARFHRQPRLRNLYVGLTLVIGLWLYSGVAWNADPLDLIGFPPNLLVVFVAVAVVFVIPHTAFLILHGLTLDIKTRDHVAAAWTWGEGAWYIMLWQVLPNLRGPLLVDFCLRIGSTTIRLGTLRIFGLGLSPGSPDRGSTINEGRMLLSLYLHPVLPAALALLSLVPGLCLLADGPREESLRD